MAAIAETASTHARRKALVGKLFECQGCADAIPFRDFIALPCGHALFCRKCHLRYCAHLTVHHSQRRNCTAGCAVPMTRYNPVAEHSDSAPLYMAEPAQPAAAPAATLVVSATASCSFSCSAAAVTHANPYAARVPAPAARRRRARIVAL
jgi:hypothetical protein